MTRLSGDTQNRSALLIGTLVVAALIGLALYAVKNKQAAAPKEGKAGTFDLASLPFAGKADAPVSMLVIEDFKCPVCKTFEDSIMPELHTKYVETGKVKVYSLVWPFIAKMQGTVPDDGKLAAQAAKCVFDDKGNDGFNTFKSILFRAQGDEREAWATKDRLKELAQNVEGLDQGKFATCLDTDATSARVDADIKQAEDNKVDHTPTIYVNGKEVVQTGSLEQLGKDISAAIDAAAK